MSTTTDLIPEEFPDIIQDGFPTITIRKHNNALMDLVALQAKYVTGDKAWKQLEFLIKIAKELQFYNQYFRV